MKTHATSRKGRRRRKDAVVAGYVGILFAVAILMAFLGAYLAQSGGRDYTFAYWVAGGADALLILVSVWVRWKHRSAWERLLDFLERFGSPGKERAAGGVATATASGTSSVAQSSHGSGNILVAGDMHLASPHSAPVQVRRQFRRLYELLEEASAVLDVVNDTGQPVADIRLAKTEVDDLIARLEKGERPDAVHRRSVRGLVDKAARLRSFTKIDEGGSVLQALTEELSN